MVGRSAQGEIACLQWNNAADKHESKLAFMVATNAVAALKQTGFQTVFSRNKEQLFPIGGKFGKGVRGACDDGGSFTIGRTREWHIPVTTAKTGDPISGLPPLCIQLGEAFRPGQTAIQRAKHEWDRSVPQKVRKRTGEDCNDRQ